MESTMVLNGRPALIKAQVATLVFIASEIMLFGGLLSSFVVYKSGQSLWPPEGLPFYPAEATALNTLLLLISGITNAVFRRKKQLGWAMATLALGIAFVGLQGIEWAQLVAHGLTMTVDAYGSYFYLVIGSHALHVVAGTIWYLLALIKFRTAQEWNGTTEAATLFWFFVVAIWPVIYGIVYF